jgi:hypothetical protein
MLPPSNCVVLLSLLSLSLSISLSLSLSLSLSVSIYISLLGRPSFPVIGKVVCLLYVFVRSFVGSFFGPKAAAAAAAALPPPSSPLCWSLTTTAAEFILGLLSAGSRISD